MNAEKAAELRDLIEEKLSVNLDVEPSHASDEMFYKATVLSVLDIMKKRRHVFHREYKRRGCKQVYYLSLEFLMGRSLKNNVFNLGLTDELEEALKVWNVSLDDLYECEPDAGLGNGGLGRLAACYLDSLTCEGYPAMGYCIKYEFGIFRQKIVDGWQTEMPDFWLPGGSVWLEEKAGDAVDVHFSGKMEESWSENFHSVRVTGDTVVHAVPYDLLVAGNDGRTVNVLRLWSAEAPQIDMVAFNQGDYVKAMEREAMAEVISKVLYPEDNHPEGKSLRLRQQYFLVSASVQDILRRHLRRYGTLDNLPEKAAIHINDTHPALTVPELMRFLLDECGYGWDAAWDIVTRTVAYTNHTVMKEALECWQVDLFGGLLPRVYSIIKEIDNRHRRLVWERTGDAGLVERTAIIEGGVVKMANLCAVACHSVNGVSKLHSELLKQSVFADFYRLTPEKFTGVTNGISFRRWLLQANPDLTDLLKECVGGGFVRDPSRLAKFRAYEDDPAVLQKLLKVKRANKERFARFLERDRGVKVDPSSMFDMQVKRLHEYKRQHLNAMRIILDYLNLKDNPNTEFVPRTYIFGAKAAPGYYLAKQIIQLIVALQRQIEGDPAVRDRLCVVFVEDYNVTLAERMIPAADFSEQISLASTEASGTGNMKLMLNGAVTVGTLDGANVEIRDAVGEDNIIIFGMTCDEVLSLKARGYDPRRALEGSEDARRVLDFMRRGIAGTSFEQLANLFSTADTYMALADFESYKQAAERAARIYSEPGLYAKMSLRNIAGAGEFSSDRAVKEYAERIWHVSPVYKTPEKRQKR